MTDPDIENIILEEGEDDYEPPEEGNFPVFLINF